MLPPLLTPANFIFLNIGLFFKLSCGSTPKRNLLIILPSRIELRKGGDFDKIDHLYLLRLTGATNTATRADFLALIIKEKANLRRLIELAEGLIERVQRGEKSFDERLSYSDKAPADLRHSHSPSKTLKLADYFANDLKADINALKNYANRQTGFKNIDEQRFFSPGLYVIGATSAADIRRGAWSVQLAAVKDDFAKSKFDLSILELQDESIDDLLNLLKPFCLDKSKAPVICLDYLQIVSTSKETAKLGIDYSVRKLKKFQRDTIS